MNLARVVQPLLDSLSLATGYSLALIGGAAPKVGSKKFSLTGVYSGQTKDTKQDWGEWMGEKEMRKKVWNPFMNFLLQCDPSKYKRLIVISLSNLTCRRRSSSRRREGGRPDGIRRQVRCR